MSLYQKFETDRSLEKTGIELDYGPNSKKQPTLIRIARAGGANDAYLKRMESKAKPHRRAIQHETIDKDTLAKIIREVYAETVVLGWSGVEDREGNALEYSVENAVKLFTDLPDLFLDIQEQAQNAALFRVNLRDDDAKN